MKRVGYLIKSSITSNRRLNSNNREPSGIKMKNRGEVERKRAAKFKFNYIKY